MRNATPTLLEFPIAYRSEWQDGYGAQGWKLKTAIDDREVIACTSYTGQKSQTSVLVHDMLDHLASGFWLSGYLNEARATAIHGIRNGIEVRSSYEHMIEDILRNGKLGEPFKNFLPSRTLDTIPENCTTDARVIDFLLGRLGPEGLRSKLLQGFVAAGISGVPLAYERWKKQGLLFERMHAIGRCLQGLLERGERLLVETETTAAKGAFRIGNEVCRLDLDLGRVRGRQELAEPVDR